jgi:membrane transport protein XK
MGKAYTKWKDQKYLESALKCGEIIWEKGLLKKGPGICHGIGGGGLVHLFLYRLTKDPKHLYRANKFAEFLRTETFMQGARTPDRPYSLFEGLAGTVCFIVDLLEPSKSEYPLFPVF